jgi:hypothetical protein
VNRLLLKAFFLIAAFASAILIGCNLSPGGGTDVGNPEVTRVTGSLKRADGTPAPFIQIQLRPNAFLSNPDSAPALTVHSIQDKSTDTQGFFTFDSVPRGDYRIRAMDSNALGAVMEFTADGSTVKMTLAPAILDTTGSISGKVIYRGPSRPTVPKILVAVYGMDRWTLANNAGDFTLSDLPPGRYKLRISTDVGTVLTAIVPETELTAGGKASVGSVDLGP